MPVEKRLRRYSLSSLDLHFDRFERSFGAAINEQPLLKRPQTAGMTGAGLFGNSCLPYVEPLIAEKGVRAGPRQKAAHSIADFFSRPVPIDKAVFLLQNGREGRFGWILFHRCGSLAECSNQQLTALHRQPLPRFQ